MVASTDALLRARLPTHQREHGLERGDLVVDEAGPPSAASANSKIAGAGFAVPSSDEIAIASK